MLHRGIDGTSIKPDKIGHAPKRLGHLRVPYFIGLYAGDEAPHSFSFEVDCVGQVLWEIAD